MAKEALINEKAILLATRVLRAINHKMRLEILYMLHVKKQLTVKEIHENLGVEQSVASQHLGILRKEGIVVVEKNGKFRYYCLNHQRIQQINAYATALTAGMW